MNHIKNNLEYHHIQQLENDLSKVLETFDKLDYYSLKIGKKAVKKVSDKIYELHKLRYQYDKKRLTLKN